MKRNNSFATVATILIMFLVASGPSVFASTLNVNLNPKTRVAIIDSVSTTSITLTYPPGSNLAQSLKGYSSSKTWSGSFTGSSDSSQAFQGGLEEEDRDIRIQNMNVSFSLKAQANGTALVIDKQTEVKAAVMGVFNVVNGTVHASLGWRSFHINGELTFNLEDHPVEVNLVGSAMMEQLGDRGSTAEFLVGMFGGYSLWHRATLNFSSLSTPLSTWTKSYNSLTNTTTFSKTIDSVSTLYVSANYNGQKYTLSVKSDPSANIQTEGYASASGDNLVIGSAPLYLTPAMWVAVGFLVAVVAGAGFYFARRRMRPAAGAATPVASAM